MTVCEATSHGKTATLIALRDRIAAEIDECQSSRDLAALSKRLIEILDALRVHDPAVLAEGTPLGEFMRRLDERQSS